MNVIELNEALLAARTPSTGPDLDGIRRHGRRIQHRRRAAAASVVAVTAALVAIPFITLHDPGSSTPFASNANRVQDDSPEAAFLLTAPIASPVGTVVGLGRKAYVRENGHSVGELSVWAEVAGRRLAYGSRDIDGDDQVRRAGLMQAPLLPRSGGALVRIPVPGTGEEPTYVGLIAADPDEPITATVQTRSVDTRVQSGVSATADPGYLLVWVSATAGSEPGTDLQSFTVRGPNGDLLARGTFR